MKNYTTHRQLSECEWTAGYPTISRNNRTVAWHSWALAVAIGVSFGCALVYGWRI